jgi:hypothetical protein
MILIIITIAILNAAVEDVGAAVEVAAANDIGKEEVVEVEIIVGHVI